MEQKRIEETKQKRFNDYEAVRYCRWQGSFHCCYHQHSASSNAPQLGHLLFFSRACNHLQFIFIL